VLTPTAPQRLTVLFDANCGVCRRARAWLEQQPAYVRLEFVPAGSPRARERFPALDADATLSELHVVADDGRVWSGARAWVLCLWALHATRSLSLRLSGPAGLAVAQGLVARLSAGRYTLSKVMRWEAPKSSSGA
jgi:predicted DCC family thiol-disulfide oxidoreductase YuxK